MIAVAIPRCEASVIDEAGDVSGAGEVASGGHTSGGSAAPILPFLELLIGCATGLARAGPVGSLLAMWPPIVGDFWAPRSIRQGPNQRAAEPILTTLERRTRAPETGRNPVRKSRIDRPWKAYRKSG